MRRRGAAASLCRHVAPECEGSEGVCGPLRRVVRGGRRTAGESCRGDRQPGDRRHPSNGHGCPVGYKPRNVTREQENRERRRPEHGCRGENVEDPPVCVGAHQLAVRGEPPDEEERDRQQEAVHDLDADEQRDHRQAGDDRDERADRDQDGDHTDEDRCLARPVLHPLLEAERLGDHVRGGHGEDRRGEQARAEQPGREQQLGVAAGERSERLGGVGGAVHGALVVDVEGRAGRDHDEERDQVGEDRAGRDLGPLGVQLVGPDPSLDDRRLDVELHERRDRRPRGGDEQEDIAGVQLDVRRDDRVGDVAPIRLCEDRRDRVREERDRHQHEHPLRDLRRAADDEQPDPDRGDRHRDLKRDPGEAERGADPDELADADPEVRDQHRRGRDADQRTPYCSRISSASPFPVTAPIRAAISWTTISETVIRIIIQSRS